MNRKTLSAATLCLAVLSFSATANAQDNFKSLPAGEYALDKTHASFTWKVNHLGLSSYTAQFASFDANINFNPENVEQSVVTASIDPASIKTNYPYPEKKDFDKKLSHGKDWFNAEEFPSIEFKSTKIEMTGDNKAVMTGDVTFLGITKPVDLDVTFNSAYQSHPFSQKPALGFSAVGELKRSDFGFETYLPSIGDNIQLIIETEFAKAK